MKIRLVPRLLSNLPKPEEAPPSPATHFTRRKPPKWNKEKSQQRKRRKRTGFALWPKAKLREHQRKAGASPYGHYKLTKEDCVKGGKRIRWALETRRRRRENRSAYFKAIREAHTDQSNPRAFWWPAFDKWFGQDESGAVVTIPEKEAFIRLGIPYFKRRLTI